MRMYRRVEESKKKNTVIQSNSTNRAKRLEMTGKDTYIHLHQSAFIYQCQSMSINVEQLCNAMYCDVLII